MKYIKTFEQFLNNNSNDNMSEGIKKIKFKGKKVNDLYRIIKDNDTVMVILDKGKEYSIDDIDEIRNDLNASTIFCSDEDGKEVEINISDIQSIEIDESLSSTMHFAEFVNERSMLEASITDIVGLKQVRVVISGPNLKKHSKDIINMINKHSKDNTVAYYDKTDKLVGNVVKVKIEYIERDLKSYEHGKITLEEKPLKK